MTQALTTRHEGIAAIEQVLMTGNLAELTPVQRVQYHNAVCESLGLNPLTRPFDYLTLNGKMVLYARRDCTDQLRNLKGISVAIVSREVIADLYIVTAQATDLRGRSDESIGAVSTKGLTGEHFANALMKAETKAKRRVTLSIAGLGLLDETEIDDAEEDEPKRPPVRQPQRRSRSQLAAEADQIQGQASPGPGARDDTGSLRSRLREEAGGPEPASILPGDLEAEWGSLPKLLLSAGHKPVDTVPIIGEFTKPAFATWRAAEEGRSAAALVELVVEGREATQ